VVRRAIAAALYRQAAQALDRQGATRRDLLQAYLGFHAALRADAQMDDARRELGLVCLLIGEREEALQHADRRVRQGERDGDVVMRGSGLAQRGEVLEAMGQHAQAAEVLRGALALLDPEDPGHYSTYWAALSDMGAALMRAGQFAEAYGAQFEAYTRAVAASRPQTAAADAAQLALLSVSLTQPERAVEWAQAATGHLSAEPSPMPGVAAEVHTNRSLALSAVGQHEEAAASLERARPLVAGTPLLLQQFRLASVEVADAGGRYDDAVAQLGELLADPRADPVTRAMALNARAVIRLKQGSAVPAISDLEESLELRRQLGDHRGLAVGLSNLVRAHLEAGSPSESARYADESERLWAALADDAPDEPGRAGLAERIRPVIFQAREELCLASGDMRGALTAAERGRQGPLAAILRASHPGAPVPAQPPGADRIQALAKRLNATLLLYSAQRRPEAVQPRPTWISQLRALHAWVVTPAGRISHAELAAGDFIAFYRDIREAERQPGAAARDATAVYAELGRLVLDPVAGALPAADGGRVIVLPAPFMWAFPFSALPLPGGDPLIVRCPVSYAPSVHVLEYLAALRPDGAWRPLSALVMGAPDNARALDPDGSYQDAVALPAARRATRKLAAMYGQAPLTGAGCTVAAALARMPDAELVHVESHADIDGHPRFDRPGGTILLTPGSADHGQLTSDLIESARLKARLVVLAACSTGLGMPAAEGVRGLVRAFFCAGACGVVASLWPVVDGPACTIMTWFHEALHDTGDPAAALRTAMLRARQRWSDPGIWAAFTLYGL
jgi:CHAT domain-containing protein/tetratricopeptide (TPR) repeat protein